MKLANREIEKNLIVKLDKSITADNVNGVMKFGVNNDYPQLIERLIFNSQTAKAASKVFAKFIAGSGFENDAIGYVNIGRDHKGKEITLDMIRRYAAQYIARHGGFYIHCNVNLNGEVGDTSLLPFKTCRFSKQDDAGYCAKIGTHVNWTKETELKAFKNSDVVWFDVFNLNESVLQSQIKKTGIEAYKGQVYFQFFDDEFLYPVSPFDSVDLDMDTERQIQLFKNREIRNGFSDKIVMRRVPCEDENEEAETVRKIRSWMGADGEKILIFEDEFGEDGKPAGNSGFALDKIQTNINDKLFEAWEGSLANNIRKAANALPKVLIEYETGQLGQQSGEMLKQAFFYYNALTKDIRDQFAESLSQIYKHHFNPLLNQNDNWKIKPVSLDEQTLM